MTVTALHSIAERVGANRILKTSGRFHCPFGQPDLPPETEAAWRQQLLQAALLLLQRPVTGPTVFTPEKLLTC